MTKTVLKLSVIACSSFVLFESVDGISLFKKKDKSELPVNTIFQAKEHAYSYVTALKSASSAFANTKKDLTSTKDTIIKGLANSKSYSADVDMAAAQAIVAVFSAAEEPLDIISKAFDLIRGGIDSIISAKTDRDNKETDGRSKVEQGMRTLESLPFFLAYMKTSITLLIRFTANREEPIVNSGELHKMVEKCRKQLEDRGGLIPSKKQLLEKFDDLKEKTDDEEIKNLFENNGKHVESVGEFADLLHDFIEACYEYTKSDSKGPSVFAGLADKCSLAGRSNERKNANKSVETEDEDDEEDEEDEVISTPKKTRRTATKTVDY